MITALKKIIVAIIILAVSAGIFVLVVQDREVKEDVLRATLDMFGKQLLGMVREGEDKAELEKRYNDFITKAEKDQVSEEDIERVAATILNLSNQDTVIDAEQAMWVFNIEMTHEAEAVPTLELEEEEPEEIGLEPRPIPELPKRRPRPISPIDRQRLADRLCQFHELQIQMRKLQDEKSDKEAELRQNFIFVADEGLKVAMNIDLKNQLDQKKYREVRKQLRQLEREHLVKWQDNFEKDMRRQMIKLRVHMDQLKNLKHNATIQGLDSLRVVNGDSIATAVIEGLKSAGIIPDTCDIEE